MASAAPPVQLPGLGGGVQGVVPRLGGGGGGFAGPGYGGPVPFGRGGPGRVVVGYHEAGGDHLQTLVAVQLGILVLILIAVLTLLVVRLVDHHNRKNRHRSGPPPFGPSDPLALVRMRYARGEISRDDFLKATADLTGPGPEPPAPEPPAPEPPAAPEAPAPPAPPA